MEDFSTILNAVKPKERTGQLKILAAMFCLGAISKPITTGDIREILKLNLRKDIPSNVQASLKTYGKYVQIESRSPDLWRLKESGLQRVREITGLTLESAQPVDFDIDVGIICALEQPEFAAVTEAIGGAKAWKATGNARFPHVYRSCGLVTDAGSELRVVGTTSTSMGLTAASIVTTQMIMQFRPRLVMMIGIAAGTRDGNKEFGDVLVADPSVDYNSGKVVLGTGGVRGFLPDPYPIGLNARLRSLVQRYKGNHPIFEDIRTEWDGRVPGVGNRLHLGPLGAADQVIDDPTLVIEIQKNWRKLIGVEMENYGVYRSCHEAPEPKPRFISFKSVCDFAAAKSDDWQEFAAFVAAQFAIRFVKQEWENLWPPKI